MIGQTVKNLRIKHKLIMINLFTTGVTLLVSGAVLLVNEFVSSRQALTSDLTVQARILANNSTAPLAFNDQKAAAEALNALKASPGIECAVVYDRDGKVFAEYNRAGMKALAPPAPAHDGHSFAGNRLHVAQAIMLDRERIGSIYIRSDLERLYTLMLRYVIVAVATMAVVFALALVLLLRLQKVITEPLSRLAQVMRAVSREKNYAVKAEIDSGDEIGSLAGGFNEMLEQIQKRDTKLQVEVAERRRAEEAVRTLNEGLERKVEDRTRQLREAQDELVHKEKLAMLGLIAGGMGNELRNPLGVMNNAVFFLESVMPDADETTREYLDIIKHEIDASQAIISDLLDFYWIRTPKARPVAVCDLVERALVRCTIPENVLLQTDMPEALPFLRVDPHQVEQVLRNLVTNAVQAMPNGGSLRIGARNVRGPTFEVEGRGLEHGTSNIELDADFVEISVADTGEGIAPENRGKLFQPLFTTRSRGIGLGLAFSRKLAEANGGRIEVESRRGEGATFTLVLPAGEA